MVSYTAKPSAPRTQHAQYAETYQPAANTPPYNL